MPAQSGEGPRSRFELVEKLPERVRYLRAVRARQTSLEREVELRFLAPGSSGEASEVFFGELADLTRLDHPGFLQVHDSLTLKGHPCYAVQDRRHPTLAQLVQRDAFTLEARCEAMRSLAGALSAAHVAQLVLGPVPPEQIAWDADSHTAYFVHHRLTTLDWSRDWLRHTPLKGRPPDLEERDDVFWWGLLAFWVLTRGQDAYGAGPESLRPLRGLEPAVAPSLSDVVEACLAWDRELRPEWGPELSAVLRSEPANLSRGEPPPKALNLGLASRHVLGKVAELRASGQLQVPRPRPAPGEASPDSDAALRADPDLLGAPDRRLEWRLQASRQGFSLVAEEPPGKRFGWQALLGALLAGLAVGLGAALALLPWLRP